jgi:hypothetical protein
LERWRQASTPDCRRLGDMQELAAATGPSCGLRAFDRDGPGGPPAPTVTPFSGQQGTISDDLIEVLASDHDVEVTDRVDAQLVCAGGGGARSEADVSARSPGTCRKPWPSSCFRTASKDARP